MKDGNFQRNLVAVSKDINQSNTTIQVKTAATYMPDYNKFKFFCEQNSLIVSFSSLEIYLLELITIHNVRLSTFNRKLAGVKYWLIFKHSQQQTIEQKKRIKMLREIYNDEQFLNLKTPCGVKAENYDQILQLIDKYNTDYKSDIRKRAICLVNLITANKPLEMVRLKISDFDLNNRFVRVNFNKKNLINEKKLTIDCVIAIKRYILQCELNPEDYFVGAADKWGNYVSRQIHEDSYSQSIRKWLGFAPYTIRKAQIIEMYKKGADIPTIAKQSGHKSHQTILEHYINSEISDVEKFL